MHWLLTVYFLIGNLPGPATDQGKFPTQEACQAAGDALVLKAEPVYAFNCGQELNWSQGSLRDDAQGGCEGRYSTRAIIDGKEWLIGCWGAKGKDGADLSLQARS